MAAAAHPLDNPVWRALTSYHARWAESAGRARRYRRGISIFAALEAYDAEAFGDLAGLAGPGSHVTLIGGGMPSELPSGWEVAWSGRGVQMVADGASLPRDDLPDGVRPLTTGDADQVMALIAVSTPGPFLPGTLEIGRYYGYFESGGLLAMAGERFHLDGYTELSAVSTHPEARGRGVASVLSGHVARGILARDEQPFLHVAAGNDRARRVYERLGFTVRTAVEFKTLVTPPDRA